MLAEQALSSCMGEFLTFFDDVFAGWLDAGRAIWRFGVDAPVDYDLAILRNRGAGGGQTRLA